MMIEILRTDAASDPTLPSRFFPAAGSDGALFKVTSGPYPTRDLITKALSRWCDDTMVIWYEQESGTGYFRIVDGAAPSAGEFVALPWQTVWHIHRDAKHVLDVKAFDKKEAIDQAWDALGWDDCAFDEDLNVRYNGGALSAHASSLPEVAQAISKQAKGVIIGCPACGIITTLYASSWPAINTTGCFEVTPIAQFGSTCETCLTDFVFRPHYAS